MSYSLFRSVDFGSGRTGLTSIGYRLYTIAGGFGARVTAGVAEMADGKYAATITFPDGFRGAVMWDSGEVVPVYAHAEINPETGENLDAKVSTAGGGASAIDIAAAITAEHGAGSYIRNTEPSTVSSITDGVWDEPAEDHIVSGSTGELLKKLDVGAPTAPVVAVPRRVPSIASGSSANGSEKKQITFVAKLRWTEKRPNEQMTIRNFEVLRLMCTAILYEQAEKWAEAGAAKKEAQTISDDELKDYLAGQQLTIPMATGNDGWGYSDLGGPL